MIKDALTVFCYAGIQGILRHFKYNISFNSMTERSEYLLSFWSLCLEVSFESSQIFFIDIHFLLTISEQVIAMVADLY